MCRFPSRIRVWVSCPLLWQQLSPAYQWWERSFPRPLAAAPHEWSRCRAQGQRCPQHEWYPHHQRNLKENRKVAWKDGLNTIKIKQHINHTLVPKSSWNRLQVQKGETRTYGSCGRYHRRHWCGKEKHFQVPVQSGLPSPAQRCPQHLEKLEPYCKGKSRNEATVWMLHKLCCRYWKDACTLLVCGTGRGNHSAHLAQVPCSRWDQLCRMGSSLQQLGFWSAH